MNAVGETQPDTAEHLATKHSLIDAGLVLDHQGHGDMTRGHLSIRVPDRPDRFFMKPHSIGFEEITLDNILTFDLEGVLVEGSARPHSERYIHSEIFRVRPDVNAVIHTHPTHTVAFSSTGRPMQASSQGGAAFANALPSYTETMDLIRDRTMGRGVAACLGPHKAVLLRGHGVAMTGATIAEAVVLCMMLEEAARIQLLVDAAGADGWQFPVDDVARLKKNLGSPEQFTVNFDYLVRKAKKQSRIGGIDPRPERPAVS